MTTLHFRGHGIEAAKHLLANTALGQSVRDFGTQQESNGALTVEIPGDWEPALSAGEQHLWRFLASLAGSGSVNLYELRDAVDSDSALAAAWSLGMATGHFASSSPVNFGSAF